MRIIDNYLSRSIITTFITTILIFCSLYVIIDLASNLAEILNRQVPPVILAKYYLSFFPIILIHTSPVACLIATLMTYGVANSHNEVIALRAGGLNFWQITRPAIYFTCVIAALSFWVNEKFVPQATIHSEQIRDENIILKVDSENKRKSKIKDMTFYGLGNRLYYITSFDPNTFELEGVTIITQDSNQEVKEKIVAQKGVWNGKAWVFKTCHTTSFEPGKAQAPETIDFSDEKLMDIQETPQDFLRQRLNVSSMNLRQLFSYIRRFAESGATKTLTNFEVDFHEKIAFPFKNIAVVLAGLPLTLMTGRRKAMTFTTFGLAMAIGFLYYAINAVGLALGKGGFLMPIFSAWLAPAAFVALALYLIRTKF